MLTRLGTSGRLPNISCGLPQVTRRWLESRTDGTVKLEDKPWPWQKKRFTMTREWLGERTLKRFNENSKSIAVMGNIASGKTAFAQKFAKTFGMLYAPDISNSELWVVHPYGFDIRSMRNELRTEQCKNMLYDLEQFYSEADPTKHSDGVLNFSRLFYNKRFMRFVDLNLHLFSTGQGIVVDSSPYCSLAYAHAYYDCGFINSKALDFLTNMYTNTITSFFRPHIIYYLDLPVDKCLRNVKHRGVPWECNSPVINEKFLSALDAAYKQVLFPSLHRYTEVIMLSKEDAKDWPMIVEEAEQLVLEPETQHLTANEKFKDWYDLTEERASRVRRSLSNRFQWYQLLQEQGLPAECPNSFVTGDHFVHFQKVIYGHPALKYWPGWNSAIGDSNITLGKVFGKKTYGYYEDLEYDCIGWDPVRPLNEQWLAKGLQPAAHTSH